MKFETQRHHNQFVHAINELREETNHHEKIEQWQIINLKWIWRKAKNKQDAKTWFKVELGW